MRWFNLKKASFVTLCAGILILGVQRGYTQNEVQNPGGGSLVRQTATAAGDAVTDVGEAIRGGGEAVVQQTQSLWSGSIKVAFERTASAMPMLLKGLLLLGAFWLAGILVGGGVRRLLDLTSIDERAIKEWGLEGMLKRANGATISLAQLLASVIKWVFVLFGFIAFFNAINLTMVAAPLQNVLDTIVGVVPQLLKATIILVVYWVIASLVRVALSRFLKATKLDARAAKHCDKGEEDTTKAPPSEMLGKLAFYVILLFGLPPFLEALGQKALVQPFADMLAKVLDFLPNLVAAGIIVLIGRIVATIVREFVSNLLAASGVDERFKKLEFSKAMGARSISSIAAQVVYFFIFIPIIITAVDSLGMKVIADPIKATLQSVLAAVPAMLSATIVVLIGVFIAKLVRKLVVTFLSGVGVDALPERLGLGFLTPKAGQAALSEFLGTIVWTVIILITAQQTAAVLKFDQLADLAQRIIVYLPQLVVGLVIILATLSLAKFVSNLVQSALAGQSYASFLAWTSRCAIVLVGMGMALDQLNVGQDIVMIAVGAVLGGVALALGLAFGLGGKERAREIVEQVNAKK